MERKQIDCHKVRPCGKWFTNDLQIRPAKTAIGFLYRRLTLFASPLRIQISLRQNGVAGRSSTVFSPRQVETLSTFGRFRRALLETSLM